MGRVERIGCQSEYTTLRERLRLGTRRAHDQLEAILPITSGAPSHGVYRDHLAFLLSFHRPVEANLAITPGLAYWLADLSTRFKTPALEQDLRDTCTPFATCEMSVPRPNNAFEALGIMYVLEGATLGARVLLKQLRATGVVPGPTGTAYLRSYGRNSGSKWAEMVRVLDAVPYEQEDTVIGSARKTFSSLIVNRSVWERAA